MAEDFHIQICNVTKKYGEGEGLTYALNDVSLSIRRGEFVTIIGESGSGKSTLILKKNSFEQANRIGLLAQRRKTE